MLLDEVRAVGADGEDLTVGEVGDIGHGVLEREGQCRQRKDRRGDQPKAEREQSLVH